MKIIGAFAFISVKRVISLTRISKSKPTEYRVKIKLKV